MMTRGRRGAAGSNASGGVGRILQADGVTIMRTEQPIADRAECSSSVSPPDQRRRSDLLRLIDVICAWRTRARSRYALSQLSEHTLRDIGLTWADVFLGSARSACRE